MEQNRTIGFSLTNPQASALNKGKRANDILDVQFGCCMKVDSERMDSNVLFITDDIYVTCQIRVWVQIND